MNQDHEQWWTEVGRYAAEPPAWTRLYQSKDKHMNFDDLYPSKYLKGSDVPEPTVVTIEAVKKMNMARDDQEPEYKPIIKFREFPKPMALNKTNGKRIQDVHGREIDQWIGKQMELYFNPDVQFGDETVGGLRLRAIKRANTKPRTSSDEDFNRAMDDGRNPSDIPF